jgi:hypothetical protein
MDAQIRAAMLWFWERQVTTHGDLVRAAVEALDHGAVEDGFEALKRARIGASDAGYRLACLDSGSLRVTPLE